jgi:thymidylate synthase (FAD)
MSKVQILTGDPIVAPIAEMELNIAGIDTLIDWVGKHRPECLPAPGEGEEGSGWRDLFPHDLVEELGTRHLSPNELLVELAGRKCYDSFGLKAGKKSNAEYIANTQAGDVPHASIMYHAKMSFFIGGVSRRVSHELIRNYVGADRDEEGSPSQESTRYTHHYGYYIAHPYILALEDAEKRDTELYNFSTAMVTNYEAYLDYVKRQFHDYEVLHGAPPKGLERKRVYESASPYLSHACETSWIWTTNPMALAKMFRERDNDGADLEFRRLARVWKKVCLERWPNLFPQKWMREG